jgi:hypothetical protein
MTTYLKIVNMDQLDLDLVIDILQPYQQDLSFETDTDYYKSSTGKN